MNIATILLVMLSGEGTGSAAAPDRPGPVGVKQPPAAATITWRLVCGDAPLTSGQIMLPAKDRTGKIQLTLPEVRVPTEMRFVYRAEQAGQAEGDCRGRGGSTSTPTTFWPASPSG